MRIGLAKFLDSLSVALDFVEKEILNVEPFHGQRVAAITYRFASYLKFEKEKLFAVTHAALLHDCALNEYLHDEMPNCSSLINEKDMALHCKSGERILSKLPFYDIIKEAVLYHHEKADGTGAFGKKYTDTPLFARLIHFADVLDVNWSLSENIDENKFKSICNWVIENTNTTIDKECSDLFFNSIDLEFLKSITGSNVLDFLHNSIPYIEEEIDNEAMIDLCSIFADITDYKSHFTWKHSLGVAEKAKSMGEYYGYKLEDCQKLYIAGALHDIGKLMISNNILEKPGKLDKEEYKTIQNHAYGTYKLLDNISGLDEIKRIAYLHHEKIDGSGYPFGYSGEQLTKNERLMACIDIYQALVEERPYKKGLPHKEAINILMKMANDKQLDINIVQDINLCFANESSEKNIADNSLNKSTILNNDSKVSNTEKWRCPVCGYIHEGPIPEDFICPRCEQPACIFEKL